MLLACIFLFENLVYLKSRYNRSVAPRNLLVNRQASFRCLQVLTQGSQQDLHPPVDLSLLPIQRPQYDIVIYGPFTYLRHLFPSLNVPFLL